MDAPLRRHVPFMYIAGIPLDHVDTGLQLQHSRVHTGVRPAGRFGQGMLSGSAKAAVVCAPLS